MEGNQSSSRAAKSAHIIDLRKASGGAATAVPPKSRLRRHSGKPKAAAKPKRLVRAIKPTKTEVPTPDELQVESAATPKPQARPVVAASTAPQEVAPQEYYDAPTERRFWPAFWRFLILLVVLALIICAGVYLYLKFYSS